MCGIAGFLSTSPLADARLCLQTMLDAIHHRGPDGRGVYLAPGVALGHNRLSIIDVSGGAQPIGNEDGTLQIVFNGEVFNYLELGQELLDRGHVFSTHSDTEVILHLFEEDGPACVSKLNGQWAFAIWDTRNRRLFLSRDRLGVRPLFYTTTPGGNFLFASEIKALFTCPDVRRQFDWEALGQILTFWHALPPKTAFSGVCELPPGHSATVRDGAVEVRPYWQLEYRPDEWVADGSPLREQALAQQLLHLLRDATRLRLRSDVPVGAYLSGGLDSTVVTSIASGMAGRLCTFSVRFESGDLDEGPFQNEAVRFLRTEHREIRCSNRAIADSFPAVVRHTETPLVRTGPVPLFLLARLVHEASFKVVLTGEGSDEMLGGYELFKEAKIRAFCARHPGSLRRPLLLKRLYPYLASLQAQPAACLRAFFNAGPAQPSAPFYSHLPRWRLTSRLKGLLSREMSEALRATDPIEAWSDVLPHGFNGWDLFSRAQFLEARGLLPGYILSSQGDRVAMAHSVEARYPFLDHRLVEFATRLPARLKMRVLCEKYLLKRSAAAHAPPAVLHRPKQPYRAPAAACFLGPSAPDYVADLLSRTSLSAQGVFHPDAVRHLVRRARMADCSSAGNDMALVAVLSTQLLAHEFSIY